MVQYCKNIVRWETKATKLFLRSREFLWQEGHNVYETNEECEKETVEIIKKYALLAKELLAMPVLIGKKSEKEKFAGAETTYTIEAFLPDGKALQCGTSHNLGRGFGKAFNISYLGKDEKKHIPFQNSWGISTRLIGGVVMTHSDDRGLVLPPRIAQNQIVIIPLLFKRKEKGVLNEAKKIKDLLISFNPILDDSPDYSPGYKFSEYELKGIPLRLEIGPRDLEKKQVVLVRRDSGEKIETKISNLVVEVSKILEIMQKEMYLKAKKEMKSKITKVSSLKEFKSAMKRNKLIRMNWCGESSCEENIKEKTGASTRCVLLKKEIPQGKCIFCEKKAKEVMYFSKSY